MLLLILTLIPSITDQLIRKILVNNIDFVTLEDLWFLVGEHLDHLLEAPEHSKYRE